MGDGRAAEAREGGPKDQVADNTWASRAWFRPFAALLSVVLAALLGWLSVPNKALPYDMPSEHNYMALASALAVAPWGWLLARRAVRSRVTTAFGLCFLTYAFGIVTLLVMAFIAPPSHPSDYTLNEEASGVFAPAAIVVAITPWIVVGAFAWTAIVFTLGSATGAGIGAVPRAAVGVRATLAALGLAGVIAFGATAPGWSSLRPTVADLPPKPAPHQPATVGGYKYAPGASGSPEVATIPPLLPGEDLGPDRLGPDCLLFTGDTGGPWFSAWCFVRDYPGSPKTWRTYDSQWAWDEGAFILFENGLELAKAPDFRSFGEVIYLEGEVIYPPHGNWAYFSVNARGEVASWEVTGQY